MNCTEGKVLVIDRKGALPVKLAKLDSIFRARSVAIVGASTDPNCVGRQILDNLVEYGYTGRIYAVNPKAQEVRGLRCYPSVRAIEEPVELAVLVVPRAAVLAVVEDCVAKGVRGLVVVTAGFRELDAEGAQLEAKLRERVARAGIPLLGPNCMGLFNADPEVRLNLTFSPVPPQSGYIAFLSQSGALGAAVLSLAETIRLGFSLFASLGNEAGVTHLETLEYAAADKLTRVIVLYLETFTEALRFLRIAQRVNRYKPIVCLKGGRTETGARAASSHTGALATSTHAFDAVLRQSGVLLVNTLEEMLDVAVAFAHLPLPQGQRVRVLTNAGGPGVLATDMLVRCGLELPPLTPERQEALREFVPPQSSVGNPVDLTVAGTPLMYGRAAQLLLDDPASDALLTIFVTPPRVSAPAVLAELQKAAYSATKPVVAAFTAQNELRRQAPPDKLILVGYPESAAVVLGALAEYAAWQRRPRGRSRRFDVNRERVTKLLAQVRRAGRNVLDPEESLAVLRAYGISTARYALVRNPGQLATRAKQIGFPLALKVVSPAILHKTEVGGVVLNIPNLSKLRKEYQALIGRLQAAGLAGQVRGVLLQEMVTEQREMILGFRRDPQGTPLVLVGLGGILVEALDAISLRVLPVTDQDVRDMLTEMPGARVLQAFRGLSPVAEPRLEESVLKLAQLAMDFEVIAEIDVNPFIVSAEPATCKAVDARILLR